MKKLVLSIALALSIALTLIPTPALATPGDVINFPDAYFEAAVRDAIGKPTGSITKADVADVATLDVSYKGISSLAGIEYFTTLTELNCYHNQLTELDVSKNAALTELNCVYNQLTELDVSKNTALTELYCDYNQLTELDVSKNTTLTELWCYGNQITELDVSKNTELTKLYCHYNYLPNKSAIIGLDSKRTSVYFYPQNAPTLEFVTASEWALEGIYSALNKGFVPEELQGNYSNAITRQEFCCMAVMYVEYALGNDIDDILTEQNLSRNLNAFSDTTDPYILAAYALGITNGTRAPTEKQPGIFSPNGIFSRQEAATMLMRVCKVIGMDTSDPPPSDFVDLNTSDIWAHDGINFVRAKNIMGGINTTTPTFNPRGTYSRQESIVTFDRIDRLE